MRRRRRLGGASGVMGAFLILLWTPVWSASSDSCILARLLTTAVTLSASKLSTVPAGCGVLGPDGAASPIAVDTSWTLSGEASGGGSLDTAFASGVVAMPKGAVLTLARLHVLNVRLRQPFLALAATNATQINLQNVILEVDCVTLTRLLNASESIGLARGPGYLFVGAYSGSGVSASNVNVTCALPALSTAADGTQTVAVSDSLSLLNAVAASQLPPELGGSVGPLTILAAASQLTMAAPPWQYMSMLSVSRNVTLRGDASATTILDLMALTSVIHLTPGAGFTFENFIIVNLAPLRGVLSTQGLLPLLSILGWFFDFTRVPTAPQLTLRNVTLILPPSEYAYFTEWTVIVTTEVEQVSAQAAVLKSTTTIIRLGPSPTRNSINFAQLRGTGLDLYNSTITAVPPVGYPNILNLDNLNLQFSLDVLENYTQLVVYEVSELQAILQAMQDNPISLSVVLFLLRNFTIDPTTWPANGYRIVTPLLLVGQNNLGVPTWIDFRRTPRFLTIVGCAPQMYVYMQGLQLVNLPNGMALPYDTGSGGTPPGSVQKAGLTDVSIYMSNFYSTNTDCKNVSNVYTNQSVVTITYTEYKRVYGEVAKLLGTASTGEGSALGSSFLFNLTSVVLQGIFFASLYGWGWSGFKLNLTYVLPPGVPELYNNVYEPPSPPPGPGGGGGGDGSLAGWEVALIVIGCVLAVALVAGLIAWRAVSKLKEEVEAVKSGSSEKKSTGNSSGDADGPTGNGVHGRGLGSTATGGGASGGANSGAQAAASPAALKGDKAGTPGGVAAAGNSDDSVGVDRPPLEVLNAMMAAISREMDDQHLTILEVIGQGGFGVVYRGLWKGLNVAVKTITFQDRVAGGEKAQHRAILEAAISSSLAHPNVVTTYSYDIKPLTVQGTSSDSPTSGGGGGGLKITDKRTVLDWKLYLVQEYCDGGSLRTAILKRKFFDARKNEPRVEMILDTAMELAGGLVHLHERNIIHGDLNPNNVLLKRDPAKKYGAVCKIADFGLSIKMEADQSHISNMRRGTPFYTCPQILARGNMTKAADVYSMGVIMWEMYHSCMSYRSLPTGFAARESFPNFPRRAPHELTQLVSSCLEPEPVNRPTFVQVRSRLEALLASLKRGELLSGEEVVGPDAAGDAAHLAACND